MDKKTSRRRRMRKEQSWMRSRNDAWSDEELLRYADEIAALYQPGAAGATGARPDELFEPGNCDDDRFDVDWHADLDGLVPRTARRLN